MSTSIDNRPTYLANSLASWVNESDSYLWPRSVLACQLRVIRRSNRWRRKAKEYLADLKQHGIYPQRSYDNV